MQPKNGFFAGALALGLALAPQLKADVQARVNVVAHALAASKYIEVDNLAVAGFTDADSGQRPPFSDVFEADLRQALSQSRRKWKVFGPDQQTSNADVLLTGAFRRSGDEILVHVELHAQPDGTLLWQRNVVLDGSDVAVADLPAQAAEDSTVAGPSLSPDETVYSAVPEEQVVPIMPRRTPGRRWRYTNDDEGWDIDFSVAYKAFMSSNGDFRSTAGKEQSALSLGLDFNNIFLWDVDFWNQPVSNLGTAQSLDYAGTDVALVYPFHLGHFTLYLGPGGRFGEITVNDPALWRDSVGFGNNALTGVVGAKWKSDDVGVDLRYSGDIVSNYVAFNTVRLGVFYEFGR